MSAATERYTRQERQRVAFFNDPKVRAVVFQAALLIAVFWFGWFIVDNTIQNLRALNIASGYGFLNTTAGFSLSFTLIPYAETSSYGRALVVGFLNTLLVASTGIVAATVLGFLIGIMRLSRNWVISKLATIYIEFVRNIPLLLQIFIWYSAVLAPLPGPRQAPELGLPYPSWGILVFVPLLAIGIYGLIRGYREFQHSTLVRLALSIGFVLWLVMMWHVLNGLGLSVFEFVPMGMFLSNRGILVPEPVFEPGSGIALYALIIALVGAWLVRRWAIKRQFETGEQFPHVLTGLGLIVGLPLLALVLAGWPISAEMPELRGFNFVGGANLVPEFTALFLALSIYTASFIAEIVRAGIQAVSHGQTEAAYALGFRRSLTLRLVIIPQALRIIIPPLASQYLNLTKNSSLAVAIAYPDLVAAGGTVLNQTGQAVEVVSIWMAVYLSLSLLTSAFMNWYNSRMRLVER
jgi:general L-amino acid transport system permease protein